jgi:hypothetical protein
MGQAIASRKVTDSNFDVTKFFNLRNSSSCIMTLGSIQPLTEMSTRNLLRCKRRPAIKDDNLTTICELNVYKVWKPRRLNPIDLHGLLRIYMLYILKKFQLYIY